ncbi:hypothetical protein [Cellulomonas sp. Marseille-Q8402]
MATSTPPAPVDGSATAAAPDGRRGRRPRLLVAGVALLVLALVVAGTVWVVGYQRAQARAQADLEQAVAALEPAAEELSQWISGTREAIASAEGTAEEQVRADATAVVDAAAALDTTPPEDGSLSERAAAVRELHERVLAEIDVITAANAEVMTSAYEGTIEVDVARYQEMRAALDPVLAAGEQAWAAAPGDSAARGALRAALDAAVAVRDTPVEMTDQYLLADLGMQLQDVRVAVESATAAVTG